MNTEPEDMEAVSARPGSGENHLAQHSIQFTGYRACLECRRKKTKCDMRLPTCGLCLRTGNSCTFPTKRKSPTFKHPNGRKKRTVDAQKLERLVDLLESRLSSGNQELQDLSPQSERLISDNLIQTPKDSQPVHTPSTEGRDRDAIGFANASPPRTPEYSAEIGQTPMSCSESFDQASNWLSVPESIAIELVHLFFEKIQPWLPLLHRPKFFASYINSSASGFCVASSLGDHDKLIIHGVLALAARHSTNAYFADVPAPDRGNKLLKEACDLYGKLRAADELPNIEYLQGCVLLAVNLAVDGPCHRTWILTGISVRMAYDLDLCNLDDGEEVCSDAEEWTAMEERRRLFWVLWELDTFLSTIARRPRAIDHRRMAVLLPVSDAAWFAQEPVGSSLLATRPSQVWKCLVNSPNQDERAWFLVANYIMALAYEITTFMHGQEIEREEIVNAITCFSLLVTQRFSLGIHPGLFSLSSPAYHWIIGMHLMINSARICASTFEGNSQSSISAYSREFCRIIHHWHPETVVLGHPFLACTLLSPYIGLANRSSPGSLRDMSSNFEMNLLMFAQYGSVWKLGTLLADVAQLLDHPDSLSEEETVLAKRFIALFPALSRRQKPPPRKTSQACGEKMAGKGDEMSSERPLEALEFPLHFNEIGSQIIASNDIGPATLEEMPHFQMDLLGDWSSEFPLGDVYNDNQHFNYLQL
ncbi:uncharacterized protein FFB20_05465 [Fusarium fujikuroi]|uniref:Uncharacterized protein n=1 Tax=Fusarium fujikuroi TaxID=5127 RepID=A0A2H3SXF8_FUSFU|nr:uncharacterized protein Y057_8537 [Fusarium fujikuroi]SCN77060.1 uncharacterized protein FFB20_05465 [Fusarium fujikuroi]SCO19500.1 uncharacterized protein FFE2_14334 [Fusarium fujikuroi]SCO25278.1 uncharacterized protein FFC1_15425 [Fusarium fujikuroi]SCO52528.1 uncharacterized protein FFNC_14339 [Fusarium fujikuroi]